MIQQIKHSYYSIRKLILISLLIATIIISAVIGLWTYLQVRSNADHILNTSLAQAAHILDALLSNELEEHQLRDLQEIMRNPDLEKPTDLHQFYLEQEHDFSQLSGQQLVFQVWNKDQHLVLRSADAPFHPLSTLDFGLSTSKAEGASWRSFSLTNHREGLRFIVAVHSELPGDIRAAIALHSLYPLLFLCPILGLLIWFVVDMGLRPLSRIREELSSRSYNNLEQHIHIHKKIPEEVAPLILELNSLFSRLQEGFEREKRFTADAAHELKTPLAAIRAHSQILKRSGIEAEALEKVTRSVDRATHVIDQLLTLSRVEPHQQLTETNTIHLGHFSQELMADLIPPALEKDIEVSLEYDTTNEPSLESQVPLLNILLRNLIDNAIRYTPPHGTVAVQLSQDEKNAYIDVIDSGPGVPDTLKQRIFDRFYRTLGTAENGSGLGLSIVKIIIDLHKGTIQAKNRSDLSQGLHMHVSLPRHRESKDDNTSKK